MFRAVTCALVGIGLFAFCGVAESLAHPRRFFSPTGLQTSVEREAFFASFGLAFPTAFHQGRSFAPIDSQMIALQKLMDDSSVREWIHPEVFSAGQRTIRASIQPQVENQLAIWAMGRRHLKWFYQWRSYSLAEHQTQLKRWVKRSQDAARLLQGLVEVSTKGYPKEAKAQLYEELAHLVRGRANHEVRWVQKRLRHANVSEFEGRWPSDPQNEFVSLIRARRQLTQGVVAYVLRLYREKEGGVLSPWRTRGVLREVALDSERKVFRDFDEKTRGVLFRHFRRFAYSPTESAARSSEGYRFRGQLVVPPLAYFLARGRIGCDCSTNQSALMTFLRSERAAFLQNNGRIYGYVQWTLTEVDGRESVYLHTVQAPGVKTREIRDLLSLVRNFAIELDQLPRATPMSLPMPDLIDTLMHYHQSELRLIASEGQVREQTYLDAEARTYLEQEHGMTYSYDRPEVNREVMELSLPEVSVQLTREKAPLLTTLISQARQEDWQAMSLFLRRSRTGRRFRSSAWKQLTTPSRNFWHWYRDLKGRVGLVAWMEPRVVRTGLEDWLMTESRRQAESPSALSQNEVVAFVLAIERAFPITDPASDVFRRNEEIHRLTRDLMQLLSSGCEADLGG